MCIFSHWLALVATKPPPPPTPTHLMMDTGGDAAAAVDAPSSAPSSRTLDVTVCTVLQRERESWCLRH